MLRETHHPITTTSDRADDLVSVVDAAAGRQPGLAAVFAAPDAGGFMETTGVHAEPHSPRLLSVDENLRHGLAYIRGADRLARRQSLCQSPPGLPVVHGEQQALRPGTDEQLARPLRVRQHTVTHTFGRLEVGADALPRRAGLLAGACSWR